MFLLPTEFIDKWGDTNMNEINK